MNKEDDNIMFISDENYIVKESEFKKLVKKHNSDNDIQYYIQSVGNDFFNISSNIEVITLQNIVWTNVFIKELNEESEKLYFESIQIKQRVLSLYKFDFNNISKLYEGFQTIIQQIKQNRIQLKNQIKKLLVYYPTVRFGYNFMILRLDNMQISLRDLYNIIKFELKKLQIPYNKYKQETILTSRLCFKHNFGLNLNLKIEENAFINQIHSYLF